MGGYYLAKQKEDKPINDKQVEFLSRILADLGRENEYDIPKIKLTYTSAEAAELIGGLILDKYEQCV